MKREYNVCLYLSFFPPVLSPLHLGWLNRPKLNWLHSTTGKGQCRAESQFGEGTRRCQGAISSVAGLSCESTPFLRRTPTLTLNALTPSHSLKKCGTFLPFSGKNLSRGTQDYQLFFTEIAHTLWAVLAEAREGKDRVFLPVSSTPLSKGRSPSACWNFSSLFIFSEIKLSNSFEWTNPEIRPLVFVTVLFFSF